MLYKPCWQADNNGFHMDGLFGTQVKCPEERNSDNCEVFFFTFLKDLLRIVLNFKIHSSLVWKVTLCS